MNIRLSPHSEQLLKEQLENGPYHSPEEVIERALESLTERGQIARAADLAEFDASLDALAEGSEKLPDLPDDAFSRQNIYQNHD
jgi:Arc/MetJ-type ribon-helix-helix transcriptional regulator